MSAALLPDFPMDLRPARGCRPLPVVYFIQSGFSGPIKIGFTSTGDPWRRLAAMQTGCPDTLRVVAVWPTQKESEAMLHEKLAASRYRGEWFWPTDEVIAEVERANALMRLVTTMVHGLEGEE